VKEKAAIVESVFDKDLQRLRELEQADADNDAVKWAKAEIIHRLVTNGMHQWQVAEKYTNAKTGEPYTQAHISYVCAVWVKWHKHAYADRPWFSDAYNEVAHPPKGAHVSNNSGENEWYSPAEYVDAARDVMGGIDLDPASTPAANGIVKAETIYTAEDDGLSKPWSGRVWMNPPYAQPLIGDFAEKLAAELEAKAITAACVLVNNATETKWFQRMATICVAVCFPAGRVKFWHPDRDTATPLQGQAILYAGDNPIRFNDRFSDIGLVLRVDR
jgi:hypothetical protein